MVARISSAVFVRTNGLPAVLCASMNAQIAASRARTMRCTPRRNCVFVNSANQRSTRSNQEPYVGVKCAWNRGRVANHERIIGVLCVP